MKTTDSMHEAAGAFFSSNKGKCLVRGKNIVAQL